MWRSRMLIFALPAKGSLTTTRPRKTDWSCAAIGPTPAKLRHQTQLHHRQGASDHPMGARARSRGRAAPARSGKDAPAARDGRASLWHDQGSDGRNPLLDEDAAQGRRRDGAARAGLQSDARHEYHRRPAAHRGDESIVAPDMRLSAVAEPPRTARIRINSAYGRKSRHPRKNDRASPHRRGRDTSMLCPQVFTRPRPEADLNRAIVRLRPGRTLPPDRAASTTRC